MFDYQTILIYLSLFAIMFFLACQARRTESWFPIIIAVLIYSIIFGMRYKVGVDYMGYFDNYKYASISSYNIMQTHYESGFRFIMMTLIGLKAHFSWFFGIIAFLQLYIVFRSVKDEPEVYPYLVFTFMIGCVWLTYANGLRQQLAFCFFTLAILCVEKRNLLFYYIAIAISISMHNSAVLLLLFYPLLRYKTEWFKDEKKQLVLVLLSVIIGNLGIVEKYAGSLESYATLLGYDNYFNDPKNNELFRTITRKGVGYYVLLLIDIVLVWFSTKYKQFLNRDYVYYIYNLFFVGILIKYVFYNSLLIGRINYYFDGFGYIVSAFALLYAKDNDRRMFWLLIALYVLVFIAIMFRMESNTAFLRFYWQIPDL